PYAPRQPRRCGVVVVLTTTMWHCRGSVGRVTGAAVTGVPAGIGGRFTRHARPGCGAPGPRLSGAGAPTPHSPAGAGAAVKRGLDGWGQWGSTLGVTAGAAI